MTPFVKYLVKFVLSIAASMPGIAPLVETKHWRTEVLAIVDDILTTDATPLESLTLLNIAAFESGFERTAHGKHGEMGAFQIMPPSKNGYGAREALRRLRAQGIEGYCGCTKPCPDLTEHRTFPAKLYFWAFDPPVASPHPVIVSFGY